jgi:hypothetical protein
MNASGPEEWKVTLPIRYAHKARYAYLVVHRDGSQQWEAEPRRHFEVSPNDDVSRHDDHWQPSGFR